MIRVRNRSEYAEPQTSPPRQRGRIFENRASVNAPDRADRGAHKASLIRAALETHDLDPGNVAMVGDRAENLIGARQNGVTSVAVSWGFGSVSELEAAHPDALVHSLPELLAFVSLRR